MTSKYFLEYIIIYKCSICCHFLKKNILEFTKVLGCLIFVVIFGPDQGQNVQETYQLDVLAFVLYCQDLSLVNKQYKDCLHNNQEEAKFLSCQWTIQKTLRNFFVLFDSKLHATLNLLLMDRVVRPCHLPVLKI